MENNGTYRNLHTGVMATGFWLASCGLDGEAARKSYGWLPVEYPYPAHNQHTHTLEPDGAPVLSADSSHYVQNFRVVPLSTEALALALENARERKRREILAGANVWMEAIKAPYSELETYSWEEQRRQAQAVLAGESLAEDDVLAVLAARAGVGLEDFAGRVLANVARAKAVVNAIVPQQQALEKQLGEAQSLEEIEAINVVYRQPEGL